MDPIQLSITIGRSREELFDYLADVANHPEFTDHYLVEWHLTRENPVGLGAGARFRIQAPLNRFDWADVTVIDADRPYRLVLAGRTGKYNRIRILVTYTLAPTAGEQCRVDFEIDTQPVLPSDRLMESLARPWLRRRAARGLRRLRAIHEEGRERGRRVAVAAR